MDKDTLYWILSTMPQVIGALTGLVIAGITFVFEFLDKQVVQDSSKETIVHKFKRMLYWQTIALLGTSIAAIIYDIILLGYTPYISDLINNFRNLTWHDNMIILGGGELLLILNIGSLALLVNILVLALNPDTMSDINSELARKLKLGPKGPKSVSPEVFLDYFRKFERTVRKFFVDNEDMSRQGLRTLINVLIGENVFPPDALMPMQNIINQRNIFVHGGDIGDVNEEVINQLEQLTAHLEMELPKYRKYNRSVKQEEAFRIWIRNYVDDFNDAVQLDHSVRYEEDYGIYHVSKDGERLFVRVEDGRILFLTTPSAKKKFLDILQEKYGEGDATIEDLDAFQRAIDKDD